MLREPRPLARLQTSPHRHWFVVAAVTIAAFMGQLDASIVTVALPRIGAGLHSSSAVTEWVALSYLLVLVASVTTVGHLADVRGRKLLYLGGFAVFTVGSAACGLAPAVGWLIAARILQAVGASMLQANSTALIRHAMPRHLLARGIAVQAGAQAVGLSLGPVVGGQLVAAAGWRAIFWVNVPAGVIGFVLGWLLLPRSDDLVTRTVFDRAGAVLLFGVAGLLMVVLSLGPGWGWGSPQVLAMLAGSTILLGALLRVEYRHPLPVIDPRLFRRPAFAGGMASGLLSYAVLFGVLFVVPDELSLRNVGPGAAGLAIAPLPIALLLSSQLGGHLADRIGVAVPTAGGLLTAAGGLVWLGVDPRTADARLIALMIIGVGIGAFVPANNAAVMADAPPERAGAAGGMLNMARGLGTAIGVALSTLVFGLAVATRLPGRTSLSEADRGLTAVAITLAGLAAAAAGVSALRHRTPIERRDTTTPGSELPGSVTAKAHGELVAAIFPIDPRTRRMLVYIDIGGGRRGFVSVRRHDGLVIAGDGVGAGIRIAPDSEQAHTGEGGPPTHQLTVRPLGTTRRRRLRRHAPPPWITLSPAASAQMQSALVEELRRERATLAGAPVALYTLRSPAFRGRVTVHSVALLPLCVSRSRLALRDPPDGLRRHRSPHARSRTQEGVIHASPESPAGNCGPRFG